MMKFQILKITAAVVLCMAFFKAGAQYTLVKPGNYIELSGYITAFYNYRFYDATETDLKKNRYALDYAVFKLDGNVNKTWNYQLQLNTCALFDPASSDGFIMDAYGSYNTLGDQLEIKFGFSKVPFSKSSLVSSTESPFLQRAEIVRGAFARRDLGTTIRYSLLNKKINLYAGAYSGLGPGSLAGDNDAGGKLEYAGRAEFSYPARYRHVEVDLSDLQVPVFAVGVDGRFADKTTTGGIDYPFFTLDGKKTAYSINADFVYRGFSAHFETIRMRMEPRDSSLLYGKATTYFQGGGIIAGANYFFSKIKTVLAVRFDEFNPNDLMKGDTERNLSFAANYLFSGWNTALKVQYWKRLKDPDAAVVWNQDQLRVALQIMF